MNSGKKTVRKSTVKRRAAEGDTEQRTRTSKVVKYDSKRGRKAPKRVTRPKDDNDGPWKEVTTVRDLMIVFAKWLRRFNEWTRNITFYQEFRPSDQALLLVLSASRHFILSVLHLSRGRDYIKLDPEGTRYTERNAHADDRLAEFFGLLRELLTRLELIEPTNEEFKIFDGLIYVHHDLNSVHGKRILKYHRNNLRREVIKLLAVADRYQEGRASELKDIWILFFNAGGKLISIIRQNRSSLGL